MSPYSDPERQREHARRWMAERRAAWLAEHPCRCGAPAVTVRGRIKGLPKGIFSSSTERRARILAECGAEGWCAPCDVEEVARRRPSAGQPVLLAVPVRPGAERRGDRAPDRVTGRSGRR